MSSNQWRERAGGFLSSSSVKLKQASAGEVSKTAGSSVTDAAERAGTMVRSHWSFLQQQQKKDGGPTVQDRWRSASTVLKKNLLETKEKVAAGVQNTKEKVVIGTQEKVTVGRVKVEEIAKKVTEMSKVILANIDWWQKGSNEEAVFGVPLEILVERQNNARPIPQIVVSCVDYLVKSGLHAEYMFKQKADQLVLDRLVNRYHNDWNATLPDGVSPVDVAALLKLYLSMLPEPLLTFDLYDGIVEARGSDQLLRQYLAKLPASNYSTLECLTALLLCISQKSALNKMDSHSLAIELAPLLLWRRSKMTLLQLHRGDTEERPTIAAKSLRRFSNSKVLREGCTAEDKGLMPFKPTSVSVRVNVPGDSLPNGGPDDEKCTDMSAQIPLDDEPTSLDFAVVEAVQCLIEHHKVVFVDASRSFCENILVRLVVE